MSEQNAKSHAAVDPLHMTVLVVLLVNFIVVTVRSVRTDLVRFDWMTILNVLVALALLVVAYRTRSNALKVQDRVIRLEERVRLAALLPEPLRTQSQALSCDEYIGLRFASDAELPGLVQRTLAEHLDRKQIKEAIVTWRPDEARL